MDTEEEKYRAMVISLLDQQWAVAKGLFNKRSKVNEEAQKSEIEIENLNGKMKQDEYTVNTISLETAKIKSILVGFKEEFLQYKDVKIEKNKEIAVIKREISEFERMKDRIGNVNLRSLDIYEAVEKEFNSLIEKQKSLGKEKDEIHNLMKEIEGKKKDMFMKTFDVINKSFKRVFLELSTKGEAYLELEDPDTVFEGGLILKVRISGKRFLDLRSLSGGEKTMTALAFIFAVQDHNPASFYIFDEVDAALDKHNSEKLSSLIKKYSERAQYIIISHNDAIISEADVLYGVSMDENGMSKVVSLKVW